MTYAQLHEDAEALLARFREGREAPSPQPHAERILRLESEIQSAAQLLAMIASLLATPAPSIDAPAQPSLPRLPKVRLSKRVPRRPR